VNPTSFNVLAIRRRLGREDWAAPLSFDPDGWAFQNFDGKGSIVLTCADHSGDDWVHASIAHLDRMPSYADLKLLHYAVFEGGWAYQVFAPPSEHVNIHEYALHLFGRLDGKPVLPDFTDGTGSI
jgi:hypothetical protein